MRNSFLVCVSIALLALTMANPPLLAMQATDQDPAGTPPESTQEEATDKTENPAEDKPRKQVVKIFSSRRTLNISSPWERGEIKEVTGSGLWLGDGKILTNAHVVLYSSQLYVQPYDSSNRIAAEALFVSPEMDLAILKLDDASAFEGLAPLPFMEESPALRSAVQVYGYPTGGAAMSVTEGIVSRIEYATYSYGAAGLRIQVDAALNPGNSGGPAIVDGKVVGLVYSRFRTGENIGYLIPGEEIVTFLNDIADEKYDGKPVVREVFQRLQNEALRQRFGLTNDQTGMLVIKTNEASADYPVRVDDVMTHIGTHDIDNEGMVRLENGLRLGFGYFIPKLVKDGVFPVTIVRNGEKIQVDIPAEFKPTKIIDSLKGKYPEYFVYGPLVFVEVRSEYLTAVRQLFASGSAKRAVAADRMLANLIARESPLIQRYSDVPQFEGEQLIMVGAPLLPHKISKGYDGPPPSVLSMINGVQIKNMKHMVQVLRDLKDEQVKIEFAEKNAPYLVFNRQEIEDATEDILLDNGIPRQGSRELLREWNNRDGK